MKKNKSNAAGYTILEVLLAGSIVFLALVGFMISQMVRAGSIEMEKRTRHAHDAADAALEKLTASQWVMNNEGGSFILIDDNEIKPETCSSQWCDVLLMNDDGVRLGNNESAAGGTVWGTSAAGARREFVRRWRVERVPDQPDVREITVAVLASEDSTSPIVMQVTRIADRTP